jgi:hypothetical protein
MVNPWLNSGEFMACFREGTGGSAGMAGRLAAVDCTGFGECASATQLAANRATLVNASHTRIPILMIFMLSPFHLVMEILPS